MSKVEPTELPRKGDTPAPLYENLFTAPERQALAHQALTNDLKAELDLLRIIIRRSLAEGQDTNTITRSIARLAQASRVQQLLAHTTERNLDQTLADVLKEIGDELDT